MERFWQILKIILSPKMDFLILNVLGFMRHLGKAVL